VIVFQLPMIVSRSTPMHHMTIVVSSASRRPSGKFRA
jgi:hypothetical protein